jgi:hypothetical protein
MEEGIERLLEKLPTGEAVFAELVEAVRHLLLNDFQRLVQVLYRVDVSEKKLKELLRGHPQADAAELIAQELIDRQQEKISTRAKFKSNSDIPDEERW